MEKLNDKIRLLLDKVMFVAAGGVFLFYLGTILLFIIGLTTNLKVDVMFTFTAISGLVMTLAITLFRAQGVKDASKLPDNIKVNEEWIRLTNTKVEKEKKLRNIGTFMTINTIKDLLFKGLSLAGVTYGVLYIAINGSGEWSLILPALGNVCMAIAMGLKGYVNTYDFYNEEHIPGLKERIRRFKERENEKEQKEG